MSTIDFTKNDTYRRAYDNILQIKKHANSKEELPTLGASNGDIYSVGEDNELYIFNSGWKPFGGGGGNEGVYGLRLRPQTFGTGPGPKGKKEYSPECYWTGNFGDLADAVDAWKAGTLKDIYLDQSYYYGEEEYSSGRINVNDYNYTHCSGEYYEDFYQITALVCSGSDMFVRQLTFDNRFTTDSMRFMGSVYKSEVNSEYFPVVIGGSSPLRPPLVFVTVTGWSNDECTTSCVMTTVDSEGTLNVPRLVPASGYYYSFRIDSPLQLQLDVSFYYGTVREVVEMPDPGTLSDGSRGSFVLNENLAKSLIGKRVLISDLSNMA